MKKKIYLAVTVLLLTLAGIYVAARMILWGGPVSFRSYVLLLGDLLCLLLLLFYVYLRVPIRLHRKIRDKWGTPGKWEWLEDIGIAFRRLSPAPHWSQDLETGELLHEGSSTGIIANDSSQVAANLPWFLKHSPERLFEIAHIESTKEACQALFGMPRVPFAKPTDRRK